MIGNMAAHGVGAALVEVDAAVDTFRLGALGDTSFYTLRASTLGLIALPGQTIIVSLTAEARHGDLAIVQTAGKVYARRVGIDREDPSRIALETLQSTANVPPTHFVMRSAARVSKVIGVLFDDAPQIRSQDEAVTTDRSPILEQVTAAARVVGDSAFPLARNGHHVLLGSAGRPETLVGSPVAVIARDDPGSPDRHGFLKRLGKSLPGHRNVHYLENIGQMGEGEYVQFPVGGTSPLPGVAVVENFWKIHGVIFN